MIEVDPETGRIAEARWRPSPNFDARPPGVEPSLFVVHGISLPPGEYGGNWIEAFFCNRLDPGAHEYFAKIVHLRVSSHLLIRRSGVLVQFVSLNDRAWHAGESCYAGRDACNDFSIGVELEGCDDDPYEPAQYRRLAQVYNAVTRVYPQVAEHPVVGHSDIAPGRKTDPGPAFDWAQFTAEASMLCAAPAPRPPGLARAGAVS